MKIVCDRDEAVLCMCSAIARFDSPSNSMFRASSSLLT